MTEPNDAGTAPAAESATPPAGAAQEPPASAAAPAAASMTPEEYEKELAKVRREAAGYRTKLQQREDADKTEAEKQAEELQRLRTENAALAAAQRETETRLAVTTAARRLGFRNPDIAFAAVIGKLEFDDAGKAKNVDKALEDLAKSETYLVNGTTDYGQGPRGAALSGTNIDDMIRSATRR